MSQRIGQQIGTYRLLRVLGEGGFATVYLGEHVHLEAVRKGLWSQVEGIYQAKKVLDKRGRSRKRGGK